MCLASQKLRQSLPRPVASQITKKMNIKEMMVPQQYLKDMVYKKNLV